MYKYYNVELANRFVNDYRLPISLTDENSFEHFLTVFEKSHRAYTKYEKLVGVIETKYNGSASDFLKDYYGVRDNMIAYIENSDKYKEFINCDMSNYDVNTDIFENVTSGDVLAGNNIGEVFVSIDMSKANFQALKLMNVIEDNTYIDFVSRFTNLDYFKESKYIREVVFGKTNAKRQMKIEKYIMYNFVYLNINNMLTTYYDMELVRFNNDELIYKCHNSENFNKGELLKLNDELNCVIQISCPQVDLHIDVYKLIGYRLENKTRNSYKSMFYKKVSWNKDEIAKLPHLYAPMVYQILINHQKPEEIDYTFKYEDMTCKMDDELLLHEYIDAQSDRLFVFVTNL